jgi:hypothetical protein
LGWGEETIGVRRGNPWGEEGDGGQLAETEAETDTEVKSHDSLLLNFFKTEGQNE